MSVKKELPILEFNSVAEWRSWLTENHERSSGIWIRFQKKHMGKKSLQYPDARDQSLCFGWIDSIIKAYDAETYLQKFTPRTNTKKWSALNISRMEKLIESGEMSDAGLSRISTGLLEGKAGAPEEKPRIAPEIPIELKNALDSDRLASDNFNQMAPSHRKQYLLWIAMARQEKTRLKRTEEAISLLRNNQKLGLK